MARVILTGDLKARLRDAGSGTLEIEASNVRELLRALERHLPGIEEQVDRGLSIAIDGDIVQDPMLEPISPDSEIHFLPPIQGGT